MSPTFKLIVTQRREKVVELFINSQMATPNGSFRMVHLIRQRYTLIAIFRSAAAAVEISECKILTTCAVECVLRVNVFNFHKNIIICGVSSNLPVGLVATRACTQSRQRAV